MQVQFSKLKMIPLLAGITLAPASIANAGTISYTDEFDFQNTNFEENLTVDKFDSNLGTLQSIELEFIGSIRGDAQFESMDNADSTITATLDSSLQIESPDNRFFTELNPSVSVSEEVSAFDGTLDFDGSSGRSYTRNNGNGLQSSTTKTVQIDAPTQSDFELFTAPNGGSIDFSVNAEGSSRVEGPGNVASILSTLSAAEVQISYDYQENNQADTPRDIVEPTGMLGIGLVGGLTLFVKRKKEGTNA
jgi:hypothetical protein